MLSYSLFDLTITIDDVHYDRLYEFLKEYAILEGIEDDKRIRARDRRNTIIMRSLYITLVILNEVFNS
jgi:hypothetical protein